MELLNCFTFFPKYKNYWDETLHTISLAYLYKLFSLQVKYSLTNIFELIFFSKEQNHL